LDQRNVLVVGNSDVALREFIKTFNKNYTQKRIFVDEYISAISEKLKSDRIFMNVGLDKSVRWDLMRSNSFSKELSLAVDSLVTGSNSDYLLCINDFDVDNRIQTMMMGGGPGMPMTSSSNEFCVVTSRFQLIDTKTKRIVLEFESAGEGSVIFFAFEAALREATRKSIEHAIEYMKSGKIKF
jgi:hypothetical protein